MENELRKLYNTLLLVETKGESTKVMAECLRFTEHLIKLVNDANKKASEPVEVEPEPVKEA